MNSNYQAVYDVMRDWLLAFGGSETLSQSFKDAMRDLMSEGLLEVPKSGVSLELATRLYNAGYAAGHDDMVEGVFVDLLSVDVDTYHADVVSQLLKELNV